MSRKKQDLTPKEALFVREYMRDGNGTRAAVAAGYSAKSAAVASSKLLRKGKVRENLARLQQKLHGRLEISAEKVLQGIAEIAFFDPRKFFNEDGSLKRIVDLDDATVGALRGIEVEKLYKHIGKGESEQVGHITKIRLADRGQNLERLGRHLKLFTDKLELGGKLTSGNSLDRIAELFNLAEARAAKVSRPN